MDIYGEIILDHFKNPRNSGEVSDAQVFGEDLNPLCGDKIKIWLKLDETNSVIQYGFVGDGCAISVASASLLGEKLVGKKLDEIMKMESQDVLNLLEIPISPGRIKCALLGFSCLKKAATIYQAAQK